MRVKGSLFRCYAAVFSCLLALLLSAAPASAKATDLHPCLRAAANGETVAQMLARPSKFDCESGQSTLPAGDYWARFAIGAETKTDSQAMVFRTA
ncbi:MAG: hypothetical protein ABL928_10035, partial [Sphingorhabdus sp.]